jgi:hypothetical protein
MVVQITPLNRKQKPIFLKVFVNMKYFPTFVTVKVRHSFECLTSWENIESPMGDGSVHLNSSGLMFLRPAVRAKLWFSRSLVQVNSLLDVSKPSRKLSFSTGVFFFSLPFFKVLNTFSFPFFSFN